MSTSLSDYSTRIAALSKELGIPPGYAESRHLTLQREAIELASIGPDDIGRDCRLAPSAAQAWLALRQRALESDIQLIPLSGFRSVDRQVEIIRGKLALGESIEDILTSIAIPGYSEHHTGRAIDVGSAEVVPLVEAFANTKSYAWLARHAGDFGFRLSFPRNNPYGFIYEPWHWCWHSGEVSPPT